MLYDALQYSRFDLRVTFCALRFVRYAMRTIPCALRQLVTPFCYVLRVTRCALHLPRYALRYGISTNGHFTKFKGVNIQPTNISLTILNLIMFLVLKIQTRTLFYDGRCGAVHPKT